MSTDAAIQPKVQVYAWGLVNLSVCADNECSPEEVERQANAQHPTGLDHPWKLADDPTFATGEPQPCPCNTDPDNRTHYLLHC